MSKVRSIAVVVASVPLNGSKTKEVALGDMMFGDDDADFKDF
jgi:hypothetical protein